MIHKTLIAETAAELDKKINVHLDDGWDLYGNHQITPLINEKTSLVRIIYSQAVIKMTYTKAENIAEMKEFMVYHEPASMIATTS